MVWRRSSASVAQSTALSKPKVNAVAVRSLSIVFGTPTTGNAELVELLSDCERAVAADANQPVDAELLDSGVHAFEQVAADVLPIGDADGGRETALVRRAEDGAAGVQDAGGVLGRECDVLDGVVEPFVTLDEADAVVAELPAGFRRAADDRIEAGAVAAAGQDADSFGVHLLPPLDCCAAKTRHPKLRAWAAAQRLPVQRSRARSSIQPARLT